jgi:NAD(P)H-hydrate epimerase
MVCHSIIAAMLSIPTNIYSVASVREMDRIAIEDHATPGYDLMTRAAEASLRFAMQRFPEAKRWQVVCGAGNNAGDGYVLARLASQQGFAVSILGVVDTDTLRGDAATAWQDFVAEGGVVMPWDGVLDPEADLVVDALLGSGLQRDVGGQFADAVAAINAHPAVVFSLDIPTGINGDSGRVQGTAVNADLTTTFVGLKSGLFLHDGPAHCGELTFSGLGIDSAWTAGVLPQFRRVGDADIAAALPRRKRDANKGDYGHVLVVGGGPGMPGAARLCGEAALRSGAGRVSIATHPDHAAHLNASRPELMVHAVAGAEDLALLLAKADVVAFGPGLGQSDWAKALFARISTDPLPAVWDADALNLLAAGQSSAQSRVLTPHPGEAATLLGETAAAVQSDRPAALAALHKRYGGVIVLKGAGTLISSADDIPAISTSGNPGMAAAGMGDVLTGVIAGLAAQGLPLQQAAAIGAEIHARAGDRAAASGERGIIASDVIAALPQEVNP